MGWGSAIGGAVSGILGTAGSAYAANLSWKRQKEAMQNSHQWEVEDLRKAGLNPILSATGGSGASTGGLNMPQIDTSGLPNAAKNFFQGAMLEGQLNQQQANIDLTKAQEGAANASNALASAQAAKEFWSARSVERDYQYFKRHPDVYDATQKQRSMNAFGGGGLWAYIADALQDHSAKNIKGAN